jgi:GT2 family glycosyltransferase
VRAAIAVVAWNGHAHLTSCFESLVCQTACADVVVIDNASTDDSADIARHFEPRLAERSRQLCVLRQPANLGFTRGANVALRHLMANARHDVIVLLNQDASLAPDYIARVADALERLPHAGVLGAKILYPNNVTLQHAGGYLVRPRLLGRHYGQGESDGDGRFDGEQDVDFVTGAVFAVRMVCLEQIGIFDEVFAPGYYEDVDLCQRAQRAGWRVVYVPSARACHVESASFRDHLDRFRLSHRNRLVFAVPELAKPSFAAEFARAEREAFAAEPSETLRSLALAYLDVLLHPDVTWHARLGALDPDTRRGLIDLIAALRSDCLAELRRRRLALLPQSGTAPS